MKHLLHRDQVHRDTYFDPISIKLINTPQMQRLGRVYQLGFAHLVYRGGTHTRLSHVMGASHVSEMLVSALQRNYETAIKGDCLPAGAISPDIFLPKLKNQDNKDISISDRWEVLTYLVKWAALLHDIGHIPFGHTLEDEFSGIYSKHDSFRSERMGHLWDEVSLAEPSPIKDVFVNPVNQSLYPQSVKNLNISGTLIWQTVMMICLYKKESHSVADSEDESPFKTIYDLAYTQTHGFLFHRYMADIVSDTICADYIDYIQRDTLNVGLDSIHELRIIYSYYVGKDSDDQQLRMALSLVDKGGKSKLSICTAAKNMVRHRFDLAEIIYYHKTKAAASAMLAKVFSLIGAPAEVGKPRQSINIKQIKTFAEGLLKGGNTAIKNLRQTCEIDSLLHPAVGDEILLHWLQEKSWVQLEKSVKEKNAIKVEDSLLALSLLEGIIERRLYKVAISIDSEIVRQVQSPQGTLEENEIKAIISRFRASDAHSSIGDGKRIETALCDKINWPKGTFISYVPDRKSQAKGIETGALDKNGKVITLGEHDAVSLEVETLNNNYKGLWRFLLFVHPDYIRNIGNNCIELSKATDLLFSELFSNMDHESKIEAIRKACWFHYIPDKSRTAAKLYVDSLGDDANTFIPWKFFDFAAKTLHESTANSEEIAERALLLKYFIGKEQNIDEEKIELVKSYYKDAGSLQIAIEGLTATEKQYSRTGKPEIEGRIDAIKRIAEMLKSQQDINRIVSDDNLFSELDK